MNTVKLWFKESPLLKITFPIKLIWFFYTFFLLRFHLKESVDELELDLTAIVLIAAGYVCLFVLFRMFELIFCGKRLLQSATTILLLVYYVLAGHYHLRTAWNVDFSILSDNFGLIAQKESFQVILALFKPKDLYITLGLFILFVFLEVRYRKFSQFGHIKHRFYASVIFILTYCVSIYILPVVYDEIGMFLKTIQSHYIQTSNPHLQQLARRPFPYVRDEVNSSYQSEDRPHIFIIMVESFNAFFVNSKNKEGKEYTPFYNSLMKQGVFFKNFYGHSMQTSKGQLSILCSILPLTRQKVFTNFSHINLNCLPQILQSNGYETLFFKAFENIHFDNTYEFVAKNGFKHAKGMSSEFISAQEKKLKWGWGIPDSLFYEKFFQYVDKLHKKNKSAKFFGALTTISNHGPFNEVPQNERYLYPNQSTKRQFMANSIRVTDEYLKTFFKELSKRKYLENSIIIVTGDHGCPAGEHGSYSTFLAYNEEVFKTPFVFIWKKNKSIKAATVVDEYHSQVDIAPTLLNFVGISAKTHFIGEHLFKPITKPILMVQPYGGRYFISIVPPYKYVFRQKTKRERLYDLSEDPMEKNNMIDTFKNHDLLSKMRSHIDYIYLNELLVRENRVWFKN
ncbi:MAG: sulfatase-like hydrolase/transferase [Bacteriovoracaceae bacterium]|nr:sulfatase-like hydrolase/transferase [Bacteriovoracaceae bacterium]